MEPVSTAVVPSPWEPSALSFLVFAFLAAGLVVALLTLSACVGEKKKTPEKGRPFESGIIPTGTARVPYPVPFYLVAAFFLIFDVEGIFIFSWAIAFDRLGWPGWIQISFFIVVLLVSLLYLWKKGGLEWGPTAKR